MAIPYAPSTPYRQNSTISDLIMQAGQQQAQAQLQKGAIWGRALGNIGDIASGAILDYQKQKAEAPLRAAKLETERNQAEASRLELDSARSTQAKAARRAQAMSLPNRQEALAALASDPEGQAGLIKSFESLDKYRDGIFGEVGYQLKRSNFDPMAIQLAAKEMEAQGFDPQKIQAMASNPEALKGQVDEWLMNSPNAKHQALVMPKAPIKVNIGDGREALIDPETKQPVYTPPPAEKKPDTRSLEIRLADALASGDTATAATIKNAIAQAASAGRAPKDGPSTVDATDDVKFLMGGGTAEKLPIGVRAKAVAEAKKSGGVEGTGFVPMSGQQQTKYNDLMDLRNKAVRLNELLSNPEVSSRLGPVMGRLTDAAKEIPGIGQDTTVKEAFDLFKDLSDSELRKRSGAAISPGEYQHILEFTVASSKQPDSNKTNLKRMLGALTRDLKTLGADRLTVPGETEPLQNGTQVPGPGAGPKVGEQRTIQGQRAFWDGKGWVAR